MVALEPLMRVLIFWTCKNFTKTLHFNFLNNAPTKFKNFRQHRCRYTYCYCSSKYPSRVTAFPIPWIFLLLLNFLEWAEEKHWADFFVCFEWWMQWGGKPQLNPSWSRASCSVIKLVKSHIREGVFPQLAGNQEPFFAFVWVSFTWVANKGQTSTCNTESRNTKRKRKGSQSISAGLADAWCDEVMGEATENHSKKSWFSLLTISLMACNVRCTNWYAVECVQYRGLKNIFM
jgi:hypothetical protein